MKKSLFVALLAAAVVNSPALSQAAGDNFVFLQDYELSRVKQVDILLDDQVGDGCMPRPEAIRETAELRLRASGLEIGNDSPHSVFISGLGYAQTDYNCAVYVRVELRAIFLLNRENLPNNVSGSVVATVNQKGMLLTGPKADMQSRLRDAVSEMVDSIALDLLRARDIVVVD